MSKRTARPKTTTRIKRQINTDTYIEQREVKEDATSPVALRRAYLSRLADRVKRIPLAGIDPQAAADAANGELQLAAVYTALMTQQTEAAARPELQRVLSRLDRNMLHLSALEVLNRESHLVLLGDPGSGKSTFVNFVALCLAGEALNLPEANLAVLTAPLPARADVEAENKPKPQPWRHKNLLPVRVVLRDLAARLPAPDQPADANTLWNFMAAELGAVPEYAPHFKRELMERGGLIMLDGLDEVPDAQQRREQIKMIVQDFVSTFEKCRLLVTSRTYAYQRQDWKLTGFVEAVLSPFTSEQVTAFVDHWYTSVGALRGWTPERTQERAALLKAAIERSAGLQDLAERPLLLTLMTSLHAWRSGDLPERREELYANAVELLLYQWGRAKVERLADGSLKVTQPSLAEWLKVDREVMRAELNRLAFEAHRDQPQLVGTADLDQGKVIGALLKVTNTPDVNLARLIEHVRDRAGLLIARGEGVYTFPHRTFQEYLAACYLTDHGFPDDLADLVRADVNRWREVTLLAGAKASRGSTSTAWNLAEALVCCDVPPVDAAYDEADAWGALLAAQTLIDNDAAHLAQPARHNMPKLERVRAWLRAIVERGWLPPLDRAQAGNALAVLGDERDFDELIEIPAGRFLMGGDRRDNEKPQHLIVLPAFKIGKYPVTNVQYMRFVEATGRKWETNEVHKRGKANHPAVDVTWHDARAYCAWLTGQWRAAGRIAVNEEARLPTEAEWEKAARGMDGREWPWDIGGWWDSGWDEQKCNSDELGLNDTSPVGIFPSGASPYGCLDMSGNVWEWTSSLWGKSYDSPEFKYPYRADDGRENLAAGDDVLQVLRGGAFDGNRGLARCAFRSGYRPYFRHRSGGFRVVVAPRVASQ
ncbi:Serine/threonine-protein kinase Pkn1 [Thermoflexales bacterium]|nr:Serine/threonine-protein kinase Pkn1 [Thermoflexales bacterium]